MGVGRGRANIAACRQAFQKPGPFGCGGSDKPMLWVFPPPIPPENTDGFFSNFFCDTTVFNWSNTWTSWIPLRPSRIIPKQKTPNIPHDREAPRNVTCIPIQITLRLYSNCHDLWLEPIKHRHPPRFPKSFNGLLSFFELCKKSVLYCECILFDNATGKKSMNSQHTKTNTMPAHGSQCPEGCQMVFVKENAARPPIRRHRWGRTPWGQPAAKTHPLFWVEQQNDFQGWHSGFPKSKLLRHTFKKCIFLDTKSRRDFRLNPVNNLSWVTLHKGHYSRDFTLNSLVFFTLFTKNETTNGAFIPPPMPLAFWSCMGANSTLRVQQHRLLTSTYPL